MGVGRWRRIFRRDFLLQLQEGDERERGINSWNASPFFWGPFCPGEWNVACCDNDYMNVVMNAQAHVAYIYIYIWIQIVYEHAACMSGQMQAFEVKNSWKLGLQLVVGQATSWQLLLSMGNGKQPSFWMDQFPTFSWSFFPAYTDGLNKCRCIVAVIFVSFGNKACLLVHLSTQPSPISMAINDLVVVYFAVQVPETNLLRPDKQFLW